MLLQLSAVRATHHTTIVQQNDNHCTDNYGCCIHIVFIIAAASRGKQPDYVDNQETTESSL
jgi:hypothetical protein